MFKKLSLSECCSIADRYLRYYGSSLESFRKSDKEKEKIHNLYRKMFNSDFSSDMIRATNILYEEPYRENEILLSIQGPHCGLERLPIYFAIIGIALHKGNY